MKSAAAKARHQCRHKAAADVPARRVCPLTSPYLVREGACTGKRWSRKPQSVVQKRGTPVKNRGKALIGGIAGVALAATLMPAASAFGPNQPNHASWWETDWGSRVWGNIRLNACFADPDYGGRHARNGYIRFTRQAGPPLDTGRLYTSSAWGPGDCTNRSRTNWVWDSPIWGPQYTTKVNYDFTWF